MGKFYQKVLKERNELGMVTLGMVWIELILIKWIKGIKNPKVRINNKGP